MDTGLTHEALLQAFARYNTLFWPWNWFIYSLALLAAALASWQTQLSARIVTLVLGIIWLWSGICFLMFSLAPDYPPAVLLSLLFTLQGVVFFLAARRDFLSFAWRADIYGITGLLLVLFGLFGYPYWGYLAGGAYSQLAIVGASCPTAIFTFGLLLLTQKRVPIPLLIIPFAWAISAMMPIAAGMLEDTVLLVGGILATAMIVIRDRRRELSTFKSIE